MDIQALGEQFADEHRLPAALMVLFMRATGRPLDSFTVIPRNLLRYAADAVGVSAPTIAAVLDQFEHGLVLRVAAIAPTSFHGHLPAWLPQHRRPCSLARNRRGGSVAGMLRPNGFALVSEDACSLSGQAVAAVPASNQGR